MGTVTTGLYEEDLYGTNPANLVQNERHTLVTPGSKKDYYFFIPNAAPFFVDSMKIINEATGLPLVEGSDYEIGHRFIEAMKSTGRPIAGSIRIMKRTLQTIARLEYRTIGGVWGFSDAAIIAELGRRQYNPLIRTWGAIDVLPYSFPSLDHNQPIDGGLVGSKEVLAGLTRIADVLEATASGTTESHLRDFNNPHRTNSTQVGLGQVQNYAMATNVEATAANRSDLYISPYGVYLAIQEHSVKRLLAHMNDFANPHKVQAVHVGLDKVPNYPAATDTQALDITNNAAFMTPYTTGLLMAKNSDGGRIDELINRLNAHINDHNNPHQTTPGNLAGGGAFTKQETTDLLKNVSATDTPRFNGKDETEWRASLPSFDDLKELCDGLTLALAQGEQVISQVNPLDPVTSADEAIALQLKAYTARSAFSMYSVGNGNDDAVLVTSSDITQFPAHLSDAAGRWVQLENAGYYADDNGAIVAFGSGAIPTPAGYGVTGHVATNVVKKIWASKSAVWIQMEDTSIYRYSSTGIAKIYNVDDTPRDIWIGNEHRFDGELAVAHVRNNEFIPHGDSNWVTKARVVMASINAKGSPITDVRIGDEYVMFLTAAHLVYLYQIVRLPTFDLVELPLQSVKNASTGVSVPINQLDKVLSISGTYDHFSILVSTGFNPAPDPNTPPTLIPEGTAYFFGDNSKGQQNLSVKSGPFIEVAAGYKFTVTINSNNNVQFWGNSPDNALLFKHRSIT